MSRSVSLNFRRWTYAAVSGLSAVGFPSFAGAVTAGLPTVDSLFGLPLLNTVLIRLMTLERPSGFSSPACWFGPGALILCCSVCTVVVT